MAVFEILGNKSREQIQKIARQIADQFGGTFEGGAADNVHIKFKTVALERVAVDTVNATMVGKVVGMTTKNYNLHVNQKWFDMMCQNRGVEEATIRFNKVYGYKVVDGVVSFAKSK